MSTKLTTSGILDDALSIIQDDSDTIRSKMLGWLNVCLQRIALDRDWPFLNKTASLVVTSNKITIPSDFASFVSASQTDSFYLDKNCQLTDEEAFNEDTSSGITNAVSFSNDGTYIYFYPGATGTVSLKYQQEVPTYTDSASATLFPIQFKTLLQRACLDFYYEYDMDERTATSYQLDQVELKRIKYWYDRQTPLPGWSKYIRN